MRSEGEHMTPPQRRGSATTRHSSNTRDSVSLANRPSALSDGGIIRLSLDDSTPESLPLHVPSETPGDDFSDIDDTSDYDRFENGAHNRASFPAQPRKAGRGIS